MSHTAPAGAFAAPPSDFAVSAMESQMPKSLTLCESRLQGADVGTGLGVRLREVGDDLQGVDKRAELVVRVENPHATLRAIVSLIDPAREVSDRVIASVVRNVPSNMNARKRGDVSWADVPGALRNDIETLAREFGYGV